MTKKEIQNLIKSDTYSLILFALFKLKDIPEYSGLSELIYLLDEQSLLSLCKYYGGLTIKIPTIEELETLIYALVLYEAVNLNNKDYNEALLELNCDNKEDVIDCYTSLIDILSEYKICN